MTPASPSTGRRAEPRVRSGMRGDFGAGPDGAPLGDYAFPYEASSYTSQDIGDWYPQIRSPDSEISIYRDRMVARQRDLVRNDGWASGVVGRILDSTIGANYRVIASPDYRALRLDNPLFDDVWANEFRHVAEARFRSYANDLGHWNDVSRQLTLAQQFRLMLRHKLIDGEALGVRYWMPERIGYGAAQYASALLVVDPDRLSNEFQGPDTRFLRNGVEIDEYNVPLAYYIRRAHQNDYYNAVESMQWDRVIREDDDGFLRVIHDYDRDRAVQSRGVSVFAPILSRMKMLAEYYGVELEAARVASTFGTYITSPFDRDLVQEALEGGEELNAYQTIRSEFHDKHTLRLRGVRIPTLVPGEKIETVKADRPHGEFSPFTHEMLRGVAACLGVSGEQVHGDYSESNYSSIRVGINEAEKTFDRRCAEFDLNSATPVYSGWMHEAMDLGDLPMPKRGYVPSFIERRTAYSRCRWLGTARGWVDQVTERQGAVLGMDAAIDTLESVCAAQGVDWEENIDQRAREYQRFKDKGLPLPEWMGPLANATRASTKPEKPEPA